MADSFPETRWSIVDAIADSDPERSRAALARLYQGYWFPLYAYVRRRGYPDEDARDLIQSYFVYLMERRFVAKANPAAGRLRALLLHTLKQFLASQASHAGALKRGGGSFAVEVDDHDASERLGEVLAHDWTPEDEFELQWAERVRQRALRRLERAARHGGYFRDFKRLLGYLDGSEARISYRELAAELERSEGALRIAVHRLRERYAKALREEIASTVHDPVEVDGEVRHVLSRLA